MNSRQLGKISSFIHIRSLINSSVVDASNISVAVVAIHGLELG